MLVVEPYDEENIKAGDTIIRRINPRQHVIWDENRNQYRVSSAAYSKSSEQNGGMSVDIEALILAGGENPKRYVSTPVFTGSVAFAAEQIRQLKLMIGYAPIPDNPYHGEVWMRTPSRRFSHYQKKGLVNAARWYVELPGVHIR